MGADRPSIFGFLNAPTGVYYWGISALLIPFLLRRHGVPVDRIADVVALASIPWVWFFLWSPLVDLGLRRRTWILLGSALSALCGFAAILQSAGSLISLTWLLVAGNVVSSLVSSAVGALLSTLPPEVRGRGSGWSQAGGVGTGSLAGGLTIWMAGYLSLTTLAFIAAALVFLPSLAALRVNEPPRLHLAPAPLFSAWFRDVRDVLWSWRTLVGLIFFLSPVGAGAVGNLISSAGPDFHASASEVAWITGAAGGAFTGLGALAGGVACDRMHRMTAYALAGFLAGLSASWLALGKPTPFTYGAGFAAYALSTGFAYAAFTALVLDVLGHRDRGAATGYSVLVAFGNLPVVYMTWLDGVGYKQGGARGLMTTDAIANGAGGLVLLLVARYFAKRWKP